MEELYLGISGFLLMVLTLFLIKIGTSIERSISKTYAIIFTTAVELYVALDALFVKCFFTEGQVDFNYFINIKVFREEIKEKMQQLV